MDTYDQTDIQEPIKRKSPIPVGFQFGLLGGALGIAFAFTGYYSNLRENFWWGILGICIFSLSIILAMKVHRDRDLGGYLTFGRAIIVGIITTFFMMLVWGVGQVVLHILDPSIVEETIEAMALTWEGMGLSDAELEANLEIADQLFNPPVYLGIMALFSPIVGLIFSIIIGVSMVRSPENKL